jgi:hypothetical protein
MALMCLSGRLCAAELPDLSTVPEDIAVPKAIQAEPAPGLRVMETTRGWEGTEVQHTLYLPTDWQSGKKLPVIVEYAGNGGYRNAFGDESTGRVEDCNMGYGITEGKGCLWLCLPYVELADGVKRNAVKWWGDVGETKRYCLATVRDVCERFGGDRSRIVLCGFSRGAIGCHYIGLHDDEIAALWRGFICHSHYDGVVEKWPYAGADRASALVRLQRLGGRHEWISHEGSTSEVEKYLAESGIHGQWTIRAIPFRNHSSRWVLRDLPERLQLREWFQKVTASP